MASKKAGDSKPRASPLSRRKLAIFIILGIVAISVVSVVVFMFNNSFTEDSTSNLVSNSQKQSIQKYVTQFCGLGSTPNSTEYVTEYTLPGTCEIPLGIAVDTNQGNSGTVWYVSTKNGTLGRYNIDKNQFGDEVQIPIWPSRQNPVSSSQVWDVQVAGSHGNGSGISGSVNGSGGIDVWLTDEQQNAIWKYTNSSNQFDIFYVPERSEAFGTTYPVSFDIDEKNNRIYFVGIRSPSIWIGDILQMKNGTSDGIEKIELPINNFSGLVDPELISTGSIAFDRKNEALWVSVLPFDIKGQIFRYDLKNHTFRTYDLPSDLRSPVGLAVTYNNYGGNDTYVWGTDHATNIFFRLDPISGNVTKFATAQLSPRVYGSDPNIPSESTYTLPYWIKSDSNTIAGNNVGGTNQSTVWFNEHIGNKIANFQPASGTLIEYWIPTQNKLWGSCHNANDLQCGIANALQFAVGKINGDEEVWFTEWTENKIGKILTEKVLPFSVNVSSPHFSVKRGESTNIQLDITPNLTNRSENNTTLHLLSSGSFSPSGTLVNATGLFSQQTIDLGKNEGTNKVSFIFTPENNLQPGDYTLMLGAETETVTILKAVSVRVI
jgi:virginiamycin B lyase